MKKIILLGATGSIGTQTLEIVREHPDKFDIVALSFGRNIGLGRKIITEFRPKKVSVQNKRDVETLRAEFPSVEFVYGISGLREIATFKEGEVVVNAVIGSVGLLPTLDAIQAKKEIAIANKETLVTAGHLVMAEAAKHNVNLLPVDSEHSAIFQALNGENKREVAKIILTASGGSFRDKSRDELKNVTVKEALNHPNWNMGNKLTIDSATMFNKGLEVIEAHWLYGTDYDAIEVVIHRESVVHSMVEFVDGSLIAQLGTPDMRIPIQYALTYPKRASISFSEPFDITKYGALHFEKVDFDRFMALKLAFQAGKIGGTMPTVLNAANEIAVAGFLNGQVAFQGIEAVVENAMHNHQVIPNPSLDTILEVDQETRAYVKTLL
ncbi:1-deoxy-D-xylulose-5-phosphate reductoisomerase [Listeria fleischmannii]|jgi:1-deoxy-D-xylulose-5-phosphate reductoisomerase|uniref:1-deoxy-D-xylulose 5-phosphate reductoisomerase n=2 Tax=Listeria fleischmannii TaxID=1069827 RepID=W7DVG0_9LIST|nr:1-deoxy-D-xylulose-5-phosphate reductoisomerase [Listeria fleischmannii]EIA20710.1 1-deoxy-D-xylulose 5-phosphate reductoisomerase [Listeria fleischmannii subsp. coloradonensis]EUJ60901.1 1-deoxy-D-xylulose 5-phosphate reductoisomerase [Listeria fleischmannii FSL S10-1203]MBC1399635.1 1-deoxy-D-xylulose-5-phosphate reductoisomerase [Listeria fleischmannii]MBC1427968.1 1-deoxy-D-xylulose-5-phosphate reductoisomerase [Listeria fleischmannii]STY34751.1 1-deoxy-D-xylulose 5-phosphate reductoiso